jgi:hypothetical protein
MPLSFPHALHMSRLYQLPLFNSLKPSGNNMHHLLLHSVGITSAFCPQCIYGLCMSEKTAIISSNKSSPATRHAGAWGERSIAPTHSRPRHQIGVSGQRHAPAALLPPGKGPPVPIVYFLK